jgi:hypothetical protein
VKRNGLGRRERCPENLIEEGEFNTKQGEEKWMKYEKE